MPVQRLSQRATQRVLYLLAGLIVGAIATSLAWAANGGDAEVRVAGRILEDGRVEFGLQQRLVEDAAWGEIERPTARYIAADAERDRWFFSSTLSVATEEHVADESVADAGDETTTVEESPTDVFGDEDGATEDTETTESESTVRSVGPFQIIGTPTSGRPFDDQTLFCVITHGNPGDFFWYQVYSAFADAKAWNGIHLRAEMYEVGTDQAAGIDQCVDDGAAAIATTLADVDALEGALGRATEAGVRVLTFNSGADRATDLGAVAHVALDEDAVGRVAAEEFVKRDVTGDILCIIHEPTNRGLEQRCNSLDATYTNGEVKRLRVAESDDIVGTIAVALSENIGGAIALNANTAYDLAEAAGDDHSDVVLAAVSADVPRPLAMLHTGSLDFVLWSHALEQGYLTITALLYAHGTPLSPNSGFFDQATQITIQPSVLTAETVANVLEQGSEAGDTVPSSWLNALEQAIEAERAGPEDATEDSTEGALPQPEEPTEGDDEEPTDQLEPENPDDSEDSESDDSDDE